MEINPYSAEIRYTLDYLVFYAMQGRPTSLRLVTASSEMARALVRRLPAHGVSVYVNNLEIQASLKDEMGFSTALFLPGQSPADVALFPFSLEDSTQVFGEEWVIGSTFNALSYKSLLYPGQVRVSWRRPFSLLKPGYQFRPVAALYSPAFIFFYALARLSEPWNSSLFFQLESFAMHRLIDFGWLWRLSYIVVFAGRAAGRC